MKSYALFSALALISNVAAIPVNSGKTDWGYILQRRQFAYLIGGLMNAGGGGKVADPAGFAPRKVAMQSRSGVPGAQTIKMRYGPYMVPNMNKKGLVGENGALWNYPDTEIAKPCEDCMILGMNAGLEYPDGTNANVDTGMWLHHYVHFVVGQGRTDATCGGRGSAPHMLIGADANNAERFFSSGNERTNMFMWQMSNGNNTGYQLRAQDKMAFIVDLMNDNMEDKTVYVTVTYDVVPGTPSGYSAFKPVWFDVAQCGTSEVRPPQQTGAFTITAQPWTANINGEIMGFAGHLHDGGQSVTLSTPSGTSCVSKATYGGTPEFIAPSGGMGNSQSATVHISNMGVCTGNGLAVKEMKQGTAWTLKADYDYSKNKGMVDEAGRQTNIMGIAIMYVKLK